MISTRTLRRGLLLSTAVAATPALAITDVDDYLRINGDSPAIGFLDDQAGEPGEATWIIRNDATSLPNGALSFRTTTNGYALVTDPVVLETGAPDFSIYLENTGDIGLGVNEPVQNIHMLDTRPAIRLEDSTAGEDDVDIVMNDDRYFLQSVLTGNFPFLVEMAAPSLSLNVAVDGSVGIGGVAANEDLELFSGNPAVRFNDTNGSNDWVLNSNNSSLVFDIANSTLGTSPFQVEALAPTATLVLDDVGNLGQGLTNPLAPLHIFRDDATDEFLLLESDEAGGAQDRAMMDLSNNGGIRFQFANNLLGTAWRFQAAAGNQDNFEIAKVGTGEIEFRVDADGNAHVAGLVFENSDRNAKTDITPVDSETVLEKVTTLPIAEWAYRESPDSRHIGPMAQDFHAAFKTGTEDTRLATMDGVGVAIASIQALNQKLEDQNRQLREEVQELRALVMKRLPQTNQN